MATPAESKSLTDRQARARYEKGKQAYQSGDYLAAATHFELAWKHFNDPSLLWNYGRALERGGEELSARDAYRELLALDGVNEKLRGKVQAALDALEAKLPPEPTLNDPGTAPPEDPVNTSATPADGGGDPSGWNTVTTPSQEGDSDLGAWLLLGGGGLAAVVGGVLVAVGQGKHDEVEDHQARAEAGIVDTLTRREAFELRDDGDSLKTTGWIGLGVGVAALATGAVLLATSDDDSTGVHVGAAVSGDGAGMVLSGRF